MRSELELPANTDAQRILFGARDSNLRLIRKELDVTLTPRKNRLLIDGEEEPVTRAITIVERLIDMIEQGANNVEHELAVLLEVADRDAGRDDPELIYTDRVRINARTGGQGTYLRAVRENALVFAVGPAGTGKTYLAVAAAVEALRHGRVRRIVLTRPAVEAGERIGFLPGDMKEKVDPYLRPIYDALYDMVPRRQLAQYMATGVIEVAPLAFMRGRTLENCFVILDEAQNTTSAQMKMLLTRLGLNSRCIVTGDVTQVDLAAGNRSGLLHATKILGGLRDVAIVRLQAEDIVRHPLVKSIVRAYDSDAENK